MAGIVHKTGWVLAGVVSLLAIAAVARIVYGGPLDPPAAPGPTDATVITALPYTISAPGKYVLKGNLATATTGISVTASDVTIDLNGFALIGPGTGCPDGISSSGAPIKNLVVRNGTIRDWCHSGIAVVTGSGALFDDLRLTGNGTSPVAALSFTRGNANNCIVEANGHAGIEMGGGRSVTVTSAATGKTESS